MVLDSIQYRHRSYLAKLVKVLSENGLGKVLCDAANIDSDLRAVWVKIEMIGTEHYICIDRGSEAGD